MRSRDGSVARTDEAISLLTRRGTDKDSEVIRRFDRTERVVHWVTSFDVLILIATGAILYVPSFSVRVGRRLLIENIHTVTGIFALVPLVVALFGRYGRQFRADVTRLTRFNAREWRWFDRTRRMRLELGKFNPGQKLNSILVTSGLVVLLGTGLVLKFPNPFPLAIRQGATFVHDWFAFGVAALVIGHIGFALAHPAALRAMVSGMVRRSWAQAHAPVWVREIDQEATEHPLERTNP